MEAYRVLKECWECQICHHIWLAQTPEPPPRCAKCKSRQWFIIGDVDMVKIEPEVSTACDPIVPAGKKARIERGEKCIHGLFYCRTCHS